MSKTIATSIKSQKKINLHKKKKFKSLKRRKLCIRKKNFCKKRPKTLIIINNIKKIKNNLLPSEENQITKNLNINQNKSQPKGKVCATNTIDCQNYLAQKINERGSLNKNKNIETKISANEPFESKDEQNCPISNNFGAPSPIDRKRVYKKRKNQKINELFKIEKNDKNDKNKKNEETELFVENKQNYKPDNIRKRIKSHFHKSIKNILNSNLKKVGSKQFFDFLPKIFTICGKVEENRVFLNMTYKEILSTDFSSKIVSNSRTNQDLTNDIFKYKNNLKVLDYLEKNPDISKKSGFDLISEMKYCDLFEQYIISEEFDKVLNKLRQENEEEDYIAKYKSIAKEFVDYFK